jgi:hypothetical protein
METLASASPCHSTVEPPEITPPRRDDRLAVPARRRAIPVERTTGIFAAMVASCGIAAAAFFGLPDIPLNPFRGDDATSRVVDRIIIAESGGCATLANERSTATGPAQFIEATWLRLIRRYRPDLAAMGRAEILALRRDRDLSREMAARFADQNAGVLRRHDIPVTPATLYLSHFAGVAGAVAIMNAPETGDAALTMANADASGRITRAIIVSANPFLADFTIADLKAWAERKMRKRHAAAANAASACPTGA